jgi:chemotaxis signal transduction protein
MRFNVMDDDINRDLEILEKRAATLARPTEELDSQTNRVSLLEFAMIGQRYAVRLANVNAVTRVSEITAIPLVPKHIPGIIRRRGESIALVSLPFFFNENRGGIADADFAVIVQARGTRFALQVEEILGVSTVLSEDLKLPQDNFDPTHAAYVSRVTLDGLMILDLAALVEAKGFAVEKYSN